MSRGERELRWARAYLSRVAEPPAPALSALIEEIGPVRAARLVVAGKVPGRVAAETGARRAEDRAEADLSVIAALGGRLVVPEDPEWPAGAFGCFTTPEQLARESGVPLHRVCSALPLLELAGLVGCGVSGWRRIHSASVSEACRCLQG
jgi:predicted Rossmann fold nucleotide-binding protein DprA/Smf involved in DNA uptake